MRVVSYLNRQSQPVLGMRVGDEVVDLTALGLPRHLEDLLAMGDAGLRTAREMAASSKAARTPFAACRLLAPLRRPSKAIAVGLNYVEHAAESNFAAPQYPVLFQRYPSSWVGPAEALQRPLASSQFDFEGELAVVIGKAGRRIPQAEALQHVAGYAIFNDGSIRDYQFKSAQWMMGKNFDRSGALGPEFVTADELPAGASGLRLQTRLNGTVVQDANTRDMIFDVRTLVSICSVAFELRPGDIIISGTPSGVGLARSPQLWMRAGDVCEVEIEGIGTLSNRVVDELADAA